jgi:hypothetical protein
MPPPVKFKIGAFWHKKKDNAISFGASCAKLILDRQYPFTYPALMHEAQTEYNKLF